MFYKKHFDHRLDILQLYLTVQDPGTAKAAEAYDGLRKLLINANRGTQVHLAHLAELHRVLSAADSTEPVRAKLSEFMNQVGLLPVDDGSHREFFEFTGGKGSVVVVDSPAYVSLDGSGDAHVVMRGVAHYEEPKTVGATHEHQQADPDVADATSSDEVGVTDEPDHDQVEGDR